MRGEKLAQYNDVFFFSLVFREENFRLFITNSFRHTHKFWMEIESTREIAARD